MKDYIYGKADSIWIDEAGTDMMKSKLETLLILAFISLVWIASLVIFSLYWITILCYITFSESVTRIRKWIRI